MKIIQFLVFKAQISFFSVAFIPYMTLLHTCAMAQNRWDISSTPAVIFLTKNMGNAKLKTG